MVSSISLYEFSNPIEVAIAPETEKNWLGKNEKHGERKLSGPNV